MASISIAEGKGWVGAAWVLRSIARRLREYGHFPSLDRGFEAVDEGVQYLDVTELPESERAELRRIVPLIVRDIKSAGPNILSDPKFYPCFVAAVEELEQVVADAYK
jgi:hypothetical protein